MNSQQEEMLYFDLVGIKENHQKAIKEIDRVLSRLEVPYDLKKK